MKSVYIAGPYTAGTEAEEDANIHNAAVVAFNYYMDGYAVYCPHLQTPYKEIVYWGEQIQATLIKTGGEEANAN